MKIYIVDSFANELFKGNQAGVVILDEKESFPSDEFMTNLAAELKHSETAFVKRKSHELFEIKYFTPAGEVDLCGHATISLFTVLREQNDIQTGNYWADTLAGKLKICVKDDMIWMVIGKAEQEYIFKPEEWSALYDAFGLPLAAKGDSLLPKIMKAGLRDIMLPVENTEILNGAKMDSQKVRLLSKEYNVIGVHMFCMSTMEGITAHCRNFAPLYNIEEEAATGTSNSGLTSYLKQYDMIAENVVNTFIQGESMNKKSYIYTRINKDQIQVGGYARIALECQFA